MRHIQHRSNYTPKPVNKPSFVYIMFSIVLFGVFCAGLVALGLAYFDVLVK